MYSCLIDILMAQAVIKMPELQPPRENPMSAIEGDRCSFQKPDCPFHEDDCIDLVVEEASAVVRRVVCP